MADLQTCTIVFLVGLISTILVRAFLFKSKTQPIPRLPPSPIPLPIIGHLHLLGPLLHQSLHKLSTRYGPLIHLRFGYVPTIVVSSPDIAKEVLKTHELFFASRPVTSAVRLLSYDNSGFIFAPYGPYWKFMKKLCVSELLGGRTLDLMLPIRRQELRSFLQLVMERSEAGETVNVGSELMKLMNNVISRMAIKRRCWSSEGEGEVGTLVKEVAEFAGKLYLGDYIGLFRHVDLQGLVMRYKDLHLRLDKIMEKITQEHERERKTRKEDGDGEKDLVDILLDVSEDESVEMKPTRENIKAFIQDIFLAGADTTSVTTEWALAELINHPTTLQKAREEIDGVVGKERLVEESDIFNLPYIQAIIKETLRLHPSVPLIMRKSIEDCKIGGYDIPAGTQTIINGWAIGRDPKHWEEPLEFRPERFMPSSDNNGDWSAIDVRGQHFHLLPFGSGRRTCPGSRMALQLVQTTVAALIQSFEWSVRHGCGQDDAVVDMTEGPGVTVPRAQNLVCVPVARINPLLLV